VLSVDGIFSWIGSHNFHPRSYGYEREVVLASFDPHLAAEYEAMFEGDIAPDKANQDAEADTHDECPVVPGGRRTKHCGVGASLTGITGMLLST
jgi:phosphatidylserine/phosphatidylglycerophosphate/cardiolipin synthase-like enzyme